MKYLKNKKYFIACLLLVLGLFLVSGHFAMAQNNAVSDTFGTDVITNANAGNIALGDDDPRAMASRIINITLGFLGILAVGLALAGGYMWMTSGGDQEKIGTARKILVNAAIGLAIILASWGIATYVLSKLIDATGSGSGSTGGSGTIPGGSATSRCVSAFDPNVCDQSGCSDNEFCDSGCFCQPIELGESCDADGDPDNGICEADQDMCGNLFVCDTLSCTCSSTPAILSVSPVGGFCVGGVDDRKPCLSNTDCDTANCDIDTPNGAVGNLITIMGAHFGDLTGEELTKTDFSEYPNAWQHFDTANSFSETSYDSGNIFSAPASLQMYQAKNRDDVWTHALWSAEANDFTVGKQYELSFKYKGFIAQELNPVIGKDLDQVFDKLMNKEQLDPTTDVLYRLGTIAGATDTGADWRRFTFLFTFSQEMSDAIGDRSNQEFGIYLDSGPSGDGANIFIDDVIFAEVDFGQRKVEFLGDPVLEGDEAVAELAIEANPLCVQSWTDTQIVVSVPEFAGAFNPYKGADGPIQVTTAEGATDRTDEGIGYPINDFIYNNIERPGLCLLTPKSGSTNDEVVYAGLKLTQSKAFFGDYGENVRALNSNFVDDFIYNNTVFDVMGGYAGKAFVPPLENGEISSFVKKIDQSSNYLNFSKLQDEPLPPNIASFDPQSGAPGQYVTIFGSGFGDTRAQNHVFFVWGGDVYEASYDFPDVCTQSVWKDNQVIVKVPSMDKDGNEIKNGDYIIRMNIGTYTIDSAGLTRPYFEINKDKALAPSLCKISPTRGPNNSDVSLWGEYFGPRDSNSRVRFYYNQDVDIMSDRNWYQEGDAMRIDTLVHEKAVSGPVSVVIGSPDNEGNGLNFQVGACEVNKDCENLQICCADGSYRAGRCVDDFMECFSESLNSVFEWDFSTGWGSTDSTSTIVLDSCAGVEREGNQCIAQYTCPNSPGFCSPYSGNQEVITGDCRYDCTNITGCEKGECEYQEVLDRCAITGVPGDCSLAKSAEVILNRSTGEKKIVNLSCDPYLEDLDGDGVLDTSYYYSFVYQTCPNEDKNGDGKNDWKMDLNGRCFNKLEPCTVCAGAFDCEDLGDKSDYMGTCVSEADECPSGGTCKNVDPNKNKCIDFDQPSCDCCCDKNKNEQAPGDDPSGPFTGDNPSCCAGLTCAESCGQAKTATADYGICSGCTKYIGGDIANGVDVEASDNACNCSGTSGKYCDTEAANGKGVCSDCAQITGSATCIDHAGTCCMDANSGACFGGNGKIFASNPGEMNYGYCAYYKCETSGAKCDAPTPDINKRQFSSQNECDAGCKGPTGGEGLSCRDESVGSCNENICKTLQCLTENGYGATNSNCGTCCCDPSKNSSDPNSSNYDVCKSLNPENPNLKCQPNVSPCNSDANLRGLCCGCTDDSDCGNSVAVGCGKDACCHARPGVESTYPADQATNVCRNASVVVNFNQRMDSASLVKKIVMFGEFSGTSTCETGTNFMAKMDELQEQNLNRFTRIAYRILKPFKLSLGQVTRFFGKDALALEIFEGPNNNYCTVDGKFESRQLADGKTQLHFIPKTLLAPETNYYVMVLGADEDFSQADVGAQNLGNNIHVGVLSLYGIDMNATYQKAFNDPTKSPLGDLTKKISFNTVKYEYSYTWGFRTMDKQAEHNYGICLIDHVELSPSSYLFQTTRENLNEDDLNSAHVTFDTEKDRDKVYLAEAVTKEGYTLFPISDIYDWEWEWSSSKSQIIRMQPEQPIGWSDKGDSVMFEVTDGATDGSSLISAIARMKVNVIIPPEDNQDKIGTAMAYLMICNNPWPVVNSKGEWYPWMDNPDGYPCLAGECGNYNYSLYYCRDTGGVGTVTDLPAIETDEVTRGKAEKLICTSDYGTCPPNAVFGQRCDGGPAITAKDVCVPEYLKESYFFRQIIPYKVELVRVNDTKLGASLDLVWKSKSLYFLYKVYYGMNGVIDQAITLDPRDTNLASPTRPSCTYNDVDEIYVCGYRLMNLENDEDYTIQVTALNEGGGESRLSNEMTAKPTDQTPPDPPAGPGGETI